jgi:hypothetical protein
VVLRQVKVGFADERHSYERYALELSKHITINDVVAHLEVNRDVIKDIQVTSIVFLPGRNLEN